MPGAVSEATVTDADWGVVAQNITDAIVQMRNSKAVRIAVAAAPPAAGNNDGIVLSRQDITTLPLTGLTSGTDIVYGKAIKGTAILSVLGIS